MFSGTMCKSGRTGSSDLSTTAPRVVTYEITKPNGLAPPDHQGVRLCRNHRRCHESSGTNDQVTKPRQSRSGAVVAAGAPTVHEQAAMHRSW